MKQATKAAFALHERRLRRSGVAPRAEICPREVQVLRANTRQVSCLFIDMKGNLPVVLIVGGGFGGLAAAKALKRSAAHVVLIDRSNHHLFQPLLYQVATSVLTPGQIGSPIRNILRKQKNTTVLLGEVTGVSPEDRSITVSDADREYVPVSYDYLVLATGATHSYFGHEEFRKHAPGLKSLADAV